ncbi:hypothetical protein [Parafilimonas terrae]|nr:hypothetical protein [Parafilimonas terrae]
MAEQIENYGFYGEVEIEFKITEYYRELQMQVDWPFERWRAGILFGATYFLEHSMQRIGLTLRVKNIEYHEVDTTNVIIAYLIYNALLKESDITQRQTIKFDKELKSFVFPK